MVTFSKISFDEYNYGSVKRVKRHFGNILGGMGEWVVVEEIRHGEGPRNRLVSYAQFPVQRLLQGEHLLSQLFYAYL